MEFIWRGQGFMKYSIFPSNNTLIDDQTFVDSRKTGGLKN